jgi:iron complex outermembrane receptor protein
VLTLAIACWAVSVSAQSQTPTKPAPPPMEDEKILFQEIAPVSGASLYDQRSSEAPANISVITADDIDRHGYRTIADVLRSVRGFYVTYDRNYSYVGARGFLPFGDYNSRILVIVDGLRTNENIFDSAFFGSEAMIDLSIIDRIEIIRGPSSSLYGTSAFLGVVNIVTKRGRDLQGGAVTGGAGDQQSYQAGGAFGRRFASGLELMASGTAYRSAGETLYFPEFDTPSTNNGVAKSIDNDQWRRLFAKASWGGFTLLGALSARQKQVPTAAFGTTFNDGRFKTNDGDGLLGLTYETPLGGPGRLSVSLSYHAYFYDGVYPVDFLLTDYAKGRWWIATSHYLRPLGARHRLIVGTEARYNSRMHQGANDATAGVPIFEIAPQSTNLAVFLQDEFRISPRWIVNAGLRHDHELDFGGTTNPRGAIIFAPDSRSTLKLLYGRAFRAPNAYELYYEDSTTQKRAEGLRPETIRTAELEFERSLGSGVLASASAFNYQIDDLITFSRDPVDDLLFYANLGHVSASGLELEVQTQLGPYLTGRGSYVYQRANDGVTGEPLSNSPRHLPKLSMNARLFGDNLSVAVDIQHLSERLASDGRASPGYTVIDANIVLRRWIRHIDTQVRLSNALNSAYGDLGSTEHVQRLIPQPGRSVQLLTHYRF